MNKKYIDSWLDLALDDLRTSQVLFKESIYPNSFYHFQQASEKGLKAYAFMSKLYTSEKDANKTGHYTLDIFKKAINERKRDITFLNELNFESLIGEKQLCEYSSNLNEGLNVIPSKKEVFEYSGQILNEIIAILEELKKYKFSLPENFDSLFKQKINSFFDLLYELNPKEIERAKEELNLVFEDEKEYKALKQSIENVLSNMLNENYHVSILYFSNLISHNHNNIARYPEIDFNPRKYYNLRKPIIKKLPVFSNYLNSTLKQLKKWNKINPTSKN